MLLLKSEEKNMKIFLDDDRNHREEGWIHVRTIPALMKLITGPDQDKITHISFDNDLRQPLEGWEGVRDLVEMRLDNPAFLPALETIIVHSANTNAATNMIGRLKCAVENGIFDVNIEYRPAREDNYLLAQYDSREIQVFS
jgi:hypothetical protein